MKTIGLFGLTFNSGNKGCVALAYSFMEILDNLNKNNDFQVKVFTYLDDSMDYYTGNMPVEVIKCKVSELSGMKLMNKKIAECDYVFDFTEGDSFSDIYGIKRMIKVSLTKLMVIHKKVPLILGPQTYGPFNSFLAKKLAKRILKKSYYVCARDEKSSNRMVKLSGKKMDVYTDIAFALPRAKDEYPMSDNKKIGINVSALLWNGGYNGNNQFGLKFDYSEYIETIIKKISEETDYEIYLIPHVISPNYEGIENDLRVCEELAKKYNLIAAPSFNTPMEIKKYMSKMDIFIGARMHATIGAFSSDVVTIPFSYSPKFEGLYSNLEYPYVIHGTQDGLEESVQNTMEYIRKKDELKEAQDKSMVQINNKLNSFYEKLDEIIK